MGPDELLTPRVQPPPPRSVAASARRAIDRRVASLFRRRPWVSFWRLHELGGLGNQLFELGAVIGLARRIGVDPILPEWRYADRFSGPFPGRRFVHVPADHPSVSDHPQPHHYYYEQLRDRAPVFLSSFYQSERFFETACDEIRRIFQPAPAIRRAVRARHADLLARGPWSLHVRRGDYMTSDLFVDLAATTDYYERALAFVPEGTPIMVFSDDIAWTRQRFAGRELHFIEGQDDVEDMALMGMGAGNIIANSTYSWWGAWLGETAGKTIVAPVPWYGGAFNNPNAPYWFFGYHDTRDLIPSRWRRI